MLNIQQIKSHILTQPLPFDLYAHLDSTNTELKRLISQKTIPLPRVCLAEQQSAGKGQVGKKWHSPFGLNIYFSYAFLFTQPLHKLEGFSLVTAIATAKALSTCLGEEKAKGIQLKWPNDILYNGQKLAGILVETLTLHPQQTYVIVGIGINVNMSATLMEEIDQPWTSLTLITGKLEDRNHIIAKVLDQVVIHLELFETTGLTPFLAQWEQYDFLKGKTVTLKNTHTHRGIAAGINTRGQLLIQTPDALSSHASGQLSWDHIPENLCNLSSP